MTVDVGRVWRELEAELGRLNAAIAAHAGGVELVELADGGEVVIRFTGFCTGCQLRPLTLAATVRPALEAIDGVTAVTAVGSRISAEAEARIARYLAA